VKVGGGPVASGHEPGCRAREGCGQVRSEAWGLLRSGRLADVGSLTDFHSARVGDCERRSPDSAGEVEVSGDDTSDARLSSSPRSSAARYVLGPAGGTGYETV